MDLEKLVKVMGYTQSPNDNEAISAIRIANNILNESNLTWEQFISQKTIIIQEVVQNTVSSKPENPEIRSMLDTCLRSITSSSGRQFIASLDVWYRKNGMLTDKQRQALERWYANVG